MSIAGIRHSGPPSGDQFEHSGFDTLSFLKEESAAMGRQACEPRDFTTAVEECLLNYTEQFKVASPDVEDVAQNVVRDLKYQFGHMVDIDNAFENMILETARAIDPGRGSIASTI